LGRYGESLTGFARPQNWARGKLIAREMDRSPFGGIGGPVLSPQVRTRVGDVEIDNPNLLYHLDRGNGAGAFSNQGAYVEDGFLFPGTPKDVADTPYSWWNEGKPFSISVKGQPMTRLMTATKDTPGMIHVKSQNYPIGQWNGKKGFVRNSEYVNPEGVNVSWSTYTLDPDYGWRKVFENTPAAQWATGRTAPQITAENAARMTPEQWTAAQDAAIARGDWTEAQRLRDLHFKVSAPNTRIKDIQYHGAKGNTKFNVFNPNLIGQTDQGWAGRGYYFTPSIDYAKMYGSEPRAFYINAQKVHDGTASTYFGREDSPAANAFKIIRKRHGNDGQQILDELASSDAIKTSFLQTQPYNGTFEEVVTRNNNQMKLADAVTYDNKGVRIPLGERDNFKLNDIRYGLLPFLGLGTTGSLYGTFNRRR